MVFLVLSKEPFAAFINSNWQREWAEIFHLQSTILKLILVTIETVF